ncbi:MAG: acetolactate synthase 2 small subunit [Endozoicomonas sp.]
MSTVFNDEQESYQFQIECHRKPEVMERVLRVVRHRGFALETMTMSLSACGSRVMTDLVVRSSRPPALLTTQIEKLYDVIKVSQQNVLPVKLKASAG